jgi:hypothetical protein
MHGGALIRFFAYFKPKRRSVKRAVPSGYVSITAGQGSARVRSR